MLIRVVLLFLIGMIALAMFGKLRLPKSRFTDKLAARKCPKCGSFRIGSGPCPCQKTK